MRATKLLVQCSLILCLGGRTVVGTDAAATPQAVIDKWSAELAKILYLPDVDEKLSVQGLMPFVSSPQQMAELMKSSSDKYARVIKATNIVME